MSDTGLMSLRPAGTVTFLFTDVAGSTRLWQSHPAEMAEALPRHDALCRTAFERWHGYVFATTGDGFAAAFARPSDALLAATNLQTEMAGEPWPAVTPIRVRIALHAGEVVERDGDYFGTAVNTAARLLAVGSGGQILLTDAVRQLLPNGAVLRDLGLHRLRDIAAPVRVWQVGNEQYPPLRSLDPPLGNLPIHASPLIGREDELAGLVAAMSSHRLVTLTGVGGVGKTRLAVAAAGALTSDHPDGRWFVDLSTREAEDDLATAVSLAIGADATASDRRLLVEHLRDRRLLLVLDNCEHLIDAAAELSAGLLARTEHVGLLVTSREPLSIDGEHVHRVRSLEIPNADGDLPTIVAAPAVALFLERAQEAAGAIDVDADARTVAQICRHLDGIPLAIELAAARTRGMSAAEMLARIDERFRLLGGGRRSRERHRTLMATVRWSHDLLTGDEQIVWRRLGVFVGGFDLDAAEAVVARRDTVEAVLSLVDKSMVQLDAGGGRTRYSMLETLRQFAADRLVEAGEVDEVRQRHCEHYLRRFGPDCPPLRGPGEYEMWPIVADERANVVVAADRLLERGRPDELVDAVTSAPEFWGVIAPADGMRLLELAASGTSSEDVGARALDLAAFLAWEAGDPNEAVRLGRAHLARSAAGERQPGGWALAALLITGNFSAALVTRDLVEAALAAADRSDDPHLSVILHSAAAKYRRRDGDPDWHRSFEDAARAASRLGSKSARVIVAVARASEELQDADGEDRARETILAVEHDVSPTPSTGGVWFHVIAARAEFRRDRARAAEHWREAIRGGDRLGSGVPVHLAYEGIALVWALEGRLTEAAVIRAVTRTYFERSGRARGEVGDVIRDQLDTALARGLHATDLAAAEEQASTLSREALLDLVLPRAAILASDPVPEPLQDSAHA